MASSNKKLITKKQQKVLDKREEVRAAHRENLRKAFEEKQGNLGKPSVNEKPKKNPVVQKKKAPGPKSSIEEFANDVLELQEAPAVGDAVDETTPATKELVKEKPTVPGKKTVTTAKKAPVKKSTTAKKAQTKKAPVKKVVEQKETD